jgi:hypothetical protein
VAQQRKSSRPRRLLKVKAARPEPSSNRLAEIQAEIREVQVQIETLRHASRPLRNAAELTTREQQVTQLTDRLARLLVAETLQQTVDDPQNRQHARSLISGAGITIKNQGQRPVTVKTQRGPIVLRVTYYSRNCDRGKTHKGLYPALRLLSIENGCTVGLASEVSQLVAMMGSLEEVECVLGERGLGLSINTIRGIAYRFAARARAVQRAGRLDWGESVAGRRVVISTDGGRLRLRTTKRGPKTAKGRNRYRTDWREPKLLIIYVLDETGKMDREFLAVLDGTLGGPQAIFALMESYLRELQIGEADQVLFVADGARWIWNRVGPLWHRLGLRPEQIHELVDFYHAVEHLGVLAAQKRGWTAAQRRSWIGRQRQRLLKGQTEAVLQEIAVVCGRSRGAVLRRERSYFQRNIQAGRMDYHRLACAKWPIGSGAIESAIRRVINLRLKGAGIFWHRKSAEAVLLLRAYYKAGSKHSVNPSTHGRRAPSPRPALWRVARFIGTGVCRGVRRRGNYELSWTGTASSLPHARRCSGLRFQGRKRSTSCAAQPPASAHA